MNVRMQPEMIQAFTYFDINVHEEFKGVTSQQDIKERLDSIVKRAKDTYKRLALQHHPDKNGSDDTKMKELNNVWGFIEQVGITQQKVQQPRVVFNGFTQTQTATTSTTGDIRVVFWNQQ